MAYTELCGGVHTPQRQRPMQIPVGFCTHFIGTRVDHGLGLCQCETTSDLKDYYTLHYNVTFVRLY